MLNSQRGRTVDLTRRMRFACWMIKATDTHIECIILIALSREQWLHERTSVLPYTHIARFALE